MKFWLGVLVVSPVWGMVSTQLFLQAWLAFAGLVCGVLGLVHGRVPRSQNLIGVGTNLLSCFLWSALLRAGFWLLVDGLEFGASTPENLIYWLFAGAFAIGSVPQVAVSLRNSWAFATVPGELDRATLRRRMASAVVVD